MFFRPKGRFEKSNDGPMDPQPAARSISATRSIRDLDGSGANGAHTGRVLSTAALNSDASVRLYEAVVFTCGSFWLRTRAMSALARDSAAWATVSDSLCAVARRM